MPHGGAGRFSDLAEVVQILEFYRYFLHLSRLAHYGKAGTGAQIAQRLPLFRVRARIYIVGNEVELLLHARGLSSPFTSHCKLHTVRLHPTVVAVVNLANPNELAYAVVRQSADYAMAIDAAAVRDNLPTLKVQGRFFGGARDALYHPHSQPYMARIIFMGPFFYLIVLT